MVERASQQAVEAAIRWPIGQQPSPRAPIAMQQSDEVSAQIW
jgi:hypothetical protein